MEKEQPVEPVVVKQMNALAKVIDGLLPVDKDGKKWGFALLMFPLGTDEGRMNYISNAARPDMLVALKEFIAKNEGRYFDDQKNTKQ